MSKDKETTDKTEDQVSIKEKLTDIGCVLGVDEDSTWSIDVSQAFDKANLGALLDILQLPKATFITKLNLSNNRLGDEEAIALAKVLKDTNITALNLDSNFLKAEGIKALAAGLKGTNITTLDLSNNCLGDEGAGALAELKGTNITTLDLRSNQIEAEGAIALADGLKDTNIAILELDYNDIEQEGAESLVRNLQNTSITQSPSYPYGKSFKCIKTHQETLSESVSKFIEENGSVSIKTSNFYTNMSPTVLQNYLEAIHSEYAADISDDSLDKLLLRESSETLLPDVGKLILEYCGRDFKLTRETYKQLFFRTPEVVEDEESFTNAPTAKVVKDEEALKEAVVNSLRGKEVITAGDWVSRSINSGSDSSSSSSSTSTMSSSEMAYSEALDF
jgi:Leucine Rich repeat